MLPRAIFDRYGGIVQRGPYANMKLGDRSNISQGSLGLKILGIYEKLVVEKISSLAKFDDFIKQITCVKNTKDTKSEMECITPSKLHYFKKSNTIF